MLHTPLCDLLGIEYPIIQGGMGPFTSAQLVAAVSNAGGLGRLGGSSRDIGDLTAQLARTKELTDRPFAVNFTWTFLHSPRTTFAGEAIATVLQARPRVLSMALGEPGDAVKKAHDAGVLFMQQVHTVDQARRAAEMGVDIIIAQGSEGGGFGGGVAALPLIPQTVDAVRPIPVVGAGGIADGRGMAAALVLGAQGVNVGTRFLACSEAQVSEDWKRAILQANSEDAIRFDVWTDIYPEPAMPGSYHTVPRSLRTSFIEDWQPRAEKARRLAAQLREDIDLAVRENRMQDKVPFTGQSAGLIHDILPAAEILRRMTTEAEQALRGASSYVI